MGWYPGKFLKGGLPLFEEAPEDIVDRIYKDIEDEKKAAGEYEELEKILRELGWTKEADIVEEIRLDEVDHRSKLEEILKELRR